jgi:S1-C subfamily serine protease
MCPVCARRVPSAQTQCRCGQPAIDVSQATADPPTPSAAAARAPILLQSAGLLVVAVAAFSGAMWWTTSRQAVVSQQVGATDSRPSSAMRPAPASRPDFETAMPAIEAPDDLAADAPQAKVPPADAGRSDSLEDLISRVMPAVVTIQTPTSRGSGFFVAPDTILTNVHVVGTDSSVTIRRPDGTTTTARVESTAPAFDIAVLKVLGVRTDQAIIPLGTAAGVRIGEEVIAIGTPLGFLQNTVTRGIVSGLRDVSGATLVQTDAAINPGNSGGPLLDRDGRAVGVIKSGYVGADGLSFAVAIEHARAVLEGRTAPAPGTASSPTQYQVLSPAVASPGDQRRLDAIRAFEQAIAQAARAADALDGQWKSFTASCYEGRIAGTFDRQWFALWDPRAMQGVVSSNCVPYFEDFRRRANGIRQSVVDIDETARRTGVYPGIRRDVLRKHRLDYWSK